MLVFLGLPVNNKGKVARGPRADTLSEAARHANSLRTELRRRGVPTEVLRYCSQEVLERNAFHAALEAAKSVLDRLRSIERRTRRRSTDHRRYACHRAARHAEDRHQRSV